MKRVLLAGTCGSDKNKLLTILGDQGYYCIDNPPLSLIHSIFNLNELATRNIAITLDARNIHKTSNELYAFIKNLLSQEKNITIIYMHSKVNTLFKHFSESRKRHPLTHEGLPLSEAIIEEQRRLTPLYECAHLVIDSTMHSSFTIKKNIETWILQKKSTPLRIELKSFGFKYGLPLDADFVFDARCLSNPYWDNDLKSLNGHDPKVIHFLNQNSDVKLYCKQLLCFLYSSIPKFNQHYRNYLTIAIGCTGGQHRSVYIVEKLAKSLFSQWPNIYIHHRELMNEKKGI
jgi:UPF0042 nucleotide-binding protein